MDVMHCVLGKSLISLFVHLEYGYCGLRVGHIMGAVYVTDVVNVVRCVRTLLLCALCNENVTVVCVMLSECQRQCAQIRPAENVMDVALFAVNGFMFLLLPFLLLRSPALSVGSTILDEIFAYVAVF